MLPVKLPSSFTAPDAVESVVVESETNSVVDADEPVDVESDTDSLVDEEEPVVVEEPVVESPPSQP